MDEDEHCIVKTRDPGWMLENFVQKTQTSQVRLRERLDDIRRRTREEDVDWTSHVAPARTEEMVAVAGPDDECSSSFPGN